MSEPQSIAANTPEAQKFKVLLWNDDDTPMEFVVWVLETVFGKSRDDAVQIMLKAHQDGTCVCCVHDAEEAGRLVKRVMTEAQRFAHPLKCTMEPD